MTGCDENDRKDQPTTAAPTDAPTGAPTDVPTDDPSGTQTEAPEPPKDDPVKDDPGSYVKLNAGLAELLLHVTDIAGDYFEKIFTGDEKIDSGSFNITANALSFAGKDYLSGNSYSLDGVLAHGKESGTVISGTLKGKEETGFRLFVTPEGTVYVMLPAVDDAVYVKLLDLGDIPSLPDGGTDGKGEPSLPGLLPGDVPTDKLPEIVKSITEEKVSITVLGKKLDGVTRLTVKVDAKALGGLAEKLPDSVGGLIAKYFPDGLPENAEAQITLCVKDGVTLLAEITISSSNGSFALSLAVVGEKGKEDYSLTIKAENKDGRTTAELTGKRENTDTLTKGSISLKTESTKKEPDKADSGSDSSDILSALLGGGTANVGFSYERKTTGNKTESLYKISFGMDMGFSTMTLTIPLTAETVRGANGSVSHTLSIDTVKAKLPKELINIRLSVSFTLGEGLEGAGAVMPTFTPENTLDPDDPDDAGALAAYTEKFRTRCKELAELLKDLFGGSEPEEPSKPEAAAPGTRG